MAHNSRKLKPAVLCIAGLLYGLLIAYVVVLSPQARFIYKTGPDSGEPLDIRSLSPVLRGEGSAALDLDLARCAEAIELSGAFLARQCLPSGKFVYKFDLDPQVTHAEGYNELRHAGAIYALASFQEYRPHDDTRLAILRSSAFLKKQCLAPLDERPDLLAVWAPRETATDAPRESKLGGAGLALVALTALERIQPGATPLEDLRRLGRFILYMQRPDGSFYSKYVPGKGGRDGAWTSLYYPGEAILGLVALYEIDADPAWLAGAAQGLTHLAKRRAGRSSVEADHWALLATAKLLPLAQKCDPPCSGDAWLAHARQICQSILEEQVPLADPVAGGGFARDGRLCPTATRLEGLLAALSFLPEHDPLRERVLASVEQGLALLLRAQVRTGEHAGAVPRAIVRLPPSHPQFDAAASRRAAEVRIDYVQHALSAMLAYQRLHENAPRSVLHPITQLSGANE